MENPGKKYFRLGPGLSVRLKSAYIIKCENFIKDDNGQVSVVHCSYIPESKSGHDTSGIIVKGTIHWVSAKHAVKATVNLYDRLFSVENPSNDEKDFKEYINLKNARPGDKYQFIRKGYFCTDKNASSGNLIFNRTVQLKDSWSKQQQKD
jgi:glutaminyl-tRNA synthetase